MYVKYPLSKNLMNDAVRAWMHMIEDATMMMMPQMLLAEKNSIHKVSSTINHAYTFLL